LRTSCVRIVASFSGIPNPTISMSRTRSQPRFGNGLISQPRYT
jgi:hypothetical protein